MSSISNITVFDGAATPVSHILVAISVTKLGNKVTAEWRETGAAIPAYAQVRLTVSLQKLKTGVYRCESRTVVPVMESVSGVNAAGYTAAPKVAYEDTVIMIGLYHERSISTGRRLARQLALNLGSNVATSVVPVSTGFIPELFDLLVMPT